MPRRSIPTCLLLLVACVWAQAPSAQGEVLFHGEPRASTAGWREAVVMVVVSHKGSTAVGNGVVFGDGTWVATAAHLLVDGGKKSKHRALGLPTVYSHAFGDAAYAAMTALDSDRDVAILRVPWPGHPSLSFADDAQIRKPEMHFVAAWGPVIEFTEMGAPCHVLRYEAYTELIEPRKGTPAKIVLHAMYPVGKGWSGGAVVGFGKQPPLVGLITDTVRLKGHKAKCVLAQAAGAIKAVARAAEGRESALIDFEPFVKRDNCDEAFTHAVRAVKARVQEKWDVALSEAEAFLKLRPQSAPAHIALARAASELGNHEVAKEHCLKAIELAPGSGQVRMAYAQCLHAAGQNAEAIAEQRKAAELLPEFEPALVILAGFLMVADRPDLAEAEAVIRRALKIEPRDAFAWLALAAALVQRGKKEEALDAARKAAALDPGSSQFEVALAAVLADAGRPDEGEKHVRAMLEKEADNAHAWFALARFLAQYQPKKTRDALNALDKVIALNTQGQVPVEKIEQLRQKLEGRLSGEEAERDK